jgi:hypothetical protein
MILNDKSLTILYPLARFNLFERHIVSNWAESGWV